MSLSEPVLMAANGSTANVRQVNRKKGAPPHLLMIPYPAPPHLVPMLTLARQIASLGGIKITFVCHQTSIDRISKSESDRSDSIQFVGVPDNLPGFDPPSDLPLRPPVLRNSFQLFYCMGPFVDKLLQDQDNLQGPTSMITDWIHWWGNDIAEKLSIPSFILTVQSATFAQILLNRTASGYQLVPGVPPSQIHHLPRIFNIENEFHRAFLARGPKCVRESDGLLLNTCAAVESEVLEALRDTIGRHVPVLPIGPLGFSPGLSSKTISMEGLQLSDETSIINWLSEQPPSSVLYVSFGTTGLVQFTKQHVTELAKGLEASGQRFVWVVRAPPGVDEYDPELLPQGFEERVKGRGLLLRGWAPQLKILAHPSTGAFLSSCGWNSAIESLALGVPVIAWPSFADQPIVARFLEETLKVAIALRFRNDFFVEAEDFAIAINVVLQSEEGKALRKRMAQYKTSIDADVAPGGSSYAAIQEFAKLI